MAKLSLTDKLTSLENWMSKNNTTGGALFIGDGLTAGKIRTFYKGCRGLSNKQTIPKLAYPAICTEIGTKIEFNPVIGTNKFRDIDIEFDIIPIIDYGTGIAKSDTVGSGRENSDMELLKLCQNIEYLIRSDITMSATCQSIEIVSSDYDVSLKADDTYVSAGKISVIMKFKNQL